MSFADISARLKKSRQDDAQEPAESHNFEEIHALRTKMLGVLLRDARLASGTTQEEAASEVAVKDDVVRDWEYGREAPSLPQLELLAYFFDVPLSQFWSDKTLTQAQKERSIPVPKDQYDDIRNRMISARMVLARKEARLSQEELAEASGQTLDTLRLFESGSPIPFPVLQSIASAVKKSVTYFIEDSGRIGSWLKMQEQYRRFSDLPEEVRAFVSLPVNQPYLEVAMKLAAMGRDDLRLVAEKILDITL